MVDAHARHRAWEIMGCQGWLGRWNRVAWWPCTSDQSRTAPLQSSERRPTRLQHRCGSYQHRSPVCTDRAVHSTAPRKRGQYFHSRSPPVPLRQSDLTRYLASPHWRPIREAPPRLMPATSKGSRRAVPQPPPPSIEPHSPLWGVGRVGACSVWPAVARCPGPVRALHRYRPLYGGAVAPPPCRGGHLRSSHHRSVW